MALKSILSIELDDSRFRKFKQVFDKYQEELKKLPKEWREINAAMASAQRTAEGLTKEASAHNEALAEQAENAKKIGSISRNTSVIWSSITNSVEHVNTHISKATSSLVKWSTLTAAFGGLLGRGRCSGLIASRQRFPPIAGRPWASAYPMASRAPSMPIMAS